MNRLIDGRIKVFQNRSSIGTVVSKTEERTKIDGIKFTFIPGEGLSIGPSYKTSFRIIESRARFSSYYVIKDDGTMRKVERENYESIFNGLFGDCPAMEQELSRNPDLSKFRNFMIITEVYNRLCVGGTN